MISWGGENGTHCTGWSAGIGVAGDVIVNSDV